MQYLVEQKFFQEEPIFSPELFVNVRKRIDEDFFNDVMLSMHWKQMKETEALHVHSCVCRIISIFQPQVCSIVRGITSNKTELGAKIGVSVVDGIT